MSLAECHDIFIDMLNVIMPSFVILGVVLLNVVMPSVVAPEKYSSLQQYGINYNRKMVFSLAQRFLCLFLIKAA
jgi:hypothetical protein